MGPDFGGSEHVHKSSTKRSFQAILLQDSVQAPRTRHQRKPSLPQCLFLNFKFFFFFVFVLIAVDGFVGFLYFANVFELLVLVFFSARARISR